MTLDHRRKHDGSKPPLNICETYVRQRRGYVQTTKAPSATKDKIKADPAPPGLTTSRGRPRKIRALTVSTAAAVGDTTIKYRHADDDPDASQAGLSTIHGAAVNTTLKRVSDPPATTTRVVHRDTGPPIASTSKKHLFKATPPRLPAPGGMVHKPEEDIEMPLFDPQTTTVKDAAYAWPTARGEYPSIWSQVKYS
ncbi:hypothetical protein B0H17DRAFT_1207381 [Mycena rosella]|uniref:Uncharacterized protein n=1 Tax=Mycena rosella TaxID=1033263 RepID=A0AAD7G876_MYCRO|nr:hypothetical protein B0H17DRAFT_1207381 [Mycena rosella]